MKIEAFAVAIAGLFFLGRPAFADETIDDEDRTAPQQVDTKLPFGPIALGSMGVVAIAVGAGFGWQADEEYDSYKETPTEKLADDVETHAIVADVLMFGGAATAIGGAIWWWIWFKNKDDGDSEEETARLKWRPEVGAGSVGATVEF